MPGLEKARAAKAESDRRLREARKRWECEFDSWLDRERLAWRAKVKAEQEFGFHSPERLEAARLYSWVWSRKPPEPTRKGV